MFWLCAPARFIARAHGSASRFARARLFEIQAPPLEFTRACVDAALPRLSIQIRICMWSSITPFAIISYTDSQRFAPVSYMFKSESFCLSITAFITYHTLVGGVQAKHNTGQGFLCVV